MLSYLADYEAYFGPLRLLRYITVRTLLEYALHDLEHHAFDVTRAR